MEEVRQLISFFSAIHEDNRIGTSHISVYMALFHFCCLNGFKNPVEITRAEIMRTAKISGLATYHKCIRDLVEAGYIQYQPSFNPAFNSRVFLLQK